MALLNGLRKTCVAFAVPRSGSHHHHHLRPIGRGTIIATTLFRPEPHRCTAGLPPWTSTTTAITTATRLFSSSFQPSSPPGTHGTPVFPDIDFSVSSSADDDGDDDDDASSKAPSSEATKRNADPNAVFVVTGASRGIGLEFVKALVERTKGTIVACCRSPDTAHGLNEYLASLLADSATTTTARRSRICVVQLDVEDQASIERAGERLSAEFDRVDLMLNVAGLLGDGGKTTPGPERSLTKMDREWFEKTLAVNLVGPVMLCKELSPLMMTKKRRRGQKKTGDNDEKTATAEERPVAVIANLSARVGSISDNGLGGWYSYRISKSGLNQATRTMALELKRHGAWCVALHPGTTETDLSEPFRANVKEGSLFPVEFTVERLLHVIDSLTEANSGGFYDWAGQSISF